MSETALKQASSPKVKDLATRIKEAQGPEIEKMKGWLRDWGEPVEPEPGEHGGHGMMTEAEMGELRAASGPSFDRLFLQAMIRHHEGAVAMAKEGAGQREVRRGQGAGRRDHRQPGSGDLRDEGAPG